MSGMGDDIVGAPENPWNAMSEWDRTQFVGGVERRRRERAVQLRKAAETVVEKTVEHEGENDD